MARWGLLGVLTLGLIGCGGAEPEDSSESEIVGNVLANVATVHEDRLVFPKDALGADMRRRIEAYADAIAGGQSKDDVENVLLVSDRQDDVVGANGKILDDAANPFGFIRRAVSLRDEGESVVVMTEPAAIADVFGELEANGMVDVGSSGTEQGEPEPSAQGEKKFKTPTIPLIDLSGVELYRNGDEYVRFSSAFVKIDATLDVGMTIRLKGLKEAHMIQTKQVSAEIALDVNVNKTPNLPLYMEVYTGFYPLPPLGPIPMTLSVRVLAGCQLAAGGGFRVTGGMGFNTGVTAGFRFTKETGVDGVFENPTFDPYVVEPTYSGISTKALAHCFVEPRVEVLFFDLAGPAVKADAYADVTFSSPPKKLSVDAGFNAAVAGTLRVYDWRILEFEKQLFDVKKNIWAKDL